MFMNFKKGFTLAEILIVLTVIGIIAAITVPTLTGGANEAMYKTGIKKAFTVISNTAGVMAAEDNLPIQRSYNAQIDFFLALNSNIKPREYISGDNIGTKPDSSVKGTALKWGNYDLGDTSGNLLTTTSGPASNSWSPWIVAQDNIAYRVRSNGNGGGCLTSAAFHGSTSLKQTDYLTSACVFVEVDVNGLDKLPNMLEPQVSVETMSGTKMTTLTGDRYYIYVAKDGVPNQTKK